MHIRSFLHQELLQYIFLSRTMNSLEPHGSSHEALPVWASCRGLEESWYPGCKTSHPGGFLGLPFINLELVDLFFLLGENTTNDSSIFLNNTFSEFRCHVGLYHVRP